MNAHSLIRQIHRWLSLTFVAAVVANLVAMAVNASATWIGLLALVPLIPLMLTGLYLFALPYLGGRRQRPAA